MLAQVLPLVPLAFITWATWLLVPGRTVAFLVPLAYVALAKWVLLADVLYAKLDDVVVVLRLVLLADLAGVSMVTVVLPLAGSLFSWLLALFSGILLVLRVALAVALGVLPPRLWLRVSQLSPVVLDVGVYSRVPEGGTCRARQVA